MSEVPANRDATGTATSNLAAALGIATGLVVVNVVLMLGLSYTPVAALGLAVFSNFFLGVGVFVVTVGGGHWLSRTALGEDRDGRVRPRPPVGAAGHVDAGELTRPRSPTSLRPVVRTGRSTQ
jgi:fatty acid desaturase